MGKGLVMLSSRMIIFKYTYIYRWTLSSIFVASFNHFSSIYHHNKYLITHRGRLLAYTSYNTGLDWTV